MSALVSLRPIDRSNWQECVELSVKPHQTGLVGANVRSLAEAYVRPEAKPMAVYEGNIMVGFSMYLRNSDDQHYYIHRFMIDGRYQNRGLGRKALMLTIDEICAQANSKDRIMLLFLTHNVDAERFYRAAGFMDTGTIVIDEKLFYYPVAVSNPATADISL
jgi:diamine N-acetyltransferase